MTEPFDEIIVYAIPMRSRFRGIDVRHGMLLRRGDRWSEWSPFPEYGDQEAATWLCAALLTDDPVIVRERVPVNVTIPVVSPSRAAELVSAAGCTTAKVKVAGAGSSQADDLARLDAVRNALGASGRIRIDANGAWTPIRAAEAITSMARIGLEYVEQPCASVDELAELREMLAHKGVGVPVAADESVRRAADPHLVVARNAADLLVIKNQPLGGWRRCLELADFGLPMVVSSALETSIGLYDSLRLAAALPVLDHACGINTARLFTDDVVTSSLIARDGHLEIGPRPVVDHQRAATLKADRTTTRWWRDRLERCLDLARQFNSAEQEES